ncbi:hypothetical protein P3T36_004976 [Kitasatospora sp. MAP12-15]|uniref:hypothetical protein n=1 Tax=unclassified Kitasatospora TaxID=2633591 RepID=UPI0024734C18|nr:hypothetical protein [Kitasatospora sp. MAP12-44]MDH6112047.1 hypothetical protein [Kitasatospora sp. MAP12-44]
MPRNRVRVAATAAATAVLAVTGLSGAAVAATPAAPTGSLVIQEDSTFLQQSSAAGIIAIALPSATSSYSSSTGLSASFPVTAGSVSLVGYYGNVQVGGSLLLVNIRTGKTAIFTNLAFSADNWAVTGVPLGATAPVSLLDPVGNTAVAKNGASQTLTSDDLEIDPAGAQYADSQLNTTFFTAGQHTGTLALTVTN